MRVLPCGDTGLLVELDGLPEVLALADAVRAAPPAGVLDVVPAARTVLLCVRPGTDLTAVRTAVLDLEVLDLEVLDLEVLDLEVEPGAAAPDGERVPVEVVYDGPDLAEVGELTGLGPDGVIAAHTGTPWRAAFGGFVPGFAYLVGGDPRLQVARRPESRTSVPAGSVGLAGEFSGVYPRRSPGGWQLIGRTAAELWTPDRGALLQPGCTVVFEVAG